MNRPRLFWALGGFALAALVVVLVALSLTTRQPRHVDMIWNDELEEPLTEPDPGRRWAVLEHEAEETFKHVLLPQFKDEPAVLANCELARARIRDRAAALLGLGAYQFEHKGQQWLSVFALNTARNTNAILLSWTSSDGQPRRHAYRIPITIRFSSFVYNKAILVKPVPDKEIVTEETIYPDELPLPADRPLAVAFRDRNANASNYVPVLPEPAELAAERLWSNVVRVSDVGKQHYFDLRTGRSIQPPGGYVIESEFYEGLAVASKAGDKPYGYIAATGKTVIAFQFDRACPFNQGWAWAEVGGKGGLIDKTGAWVIKPGTYDSIDTFVEEDLCAFLQGGKWGFLDRQGKVAIPATFVSDCCPQFSEGLCLIREIGGPASYIDKTGQVRISLPQEYCWCGPFQAGRARVSTGRPAFGGKCGYIDRNGKLVIPMEYTSGGDFSEGLAPVSRKSQVVYSSLRPHPQGDGYVNATDEPWGFIDPDNKLVVPMVYQYVWDFSEGLAPVRRNGLWGYVDKKGREVIPPKYSLAHPFDHGAAKVVREGKIQFIDRTGKTLVETGIDYVEF
ncbi:MAG: KWG Leptospira [Planctomycetes bacterium ADurb.Bin126]|mgnify:CR=1 FL=1|nr:MAG: KWG Leptospira [Planctomycetes bacterium ADurb.Bin126]HOD80451.1 WG repeat-containing protein [Phycisphaerae bacterium]HQL72766.1 WG repeat-containing protein [Phycisphaerae bacterium]